MSDFKKLVCEDCQKSYKVKRAALSKRIACPNCKRVLHPIAPASGTVNQPETKSSSLNSQKPTWLFPVLLGFAVVTAGSLTTYFWLVAPTKADQPTSTAEPKKESTDPGAVDIAATPRPKTIPKGTEPDTTGNKPLVLDESEFWFKMEATPNGKQFRWEGTSVLGQLRNPDRIFATGIAIPNRWIIVPIELVSQVHSIQIKYGDENYTAKVRKRLEKLGWATLQIERERKFSSPKVERNDTIADNGNDLKVVYYDRKQKIQVIDKISVIDGGKARYRIKRLPNEALGGLVMGKSGRICGFVATHADDVTILKPWSEIGKGWGEKRGEGIFDYLASPPSYFIKRPYVLRQHLAQVVINKVDPTEQKHAYVFHSELKPTVVIKGVTAKDYFVPGPIISTSTRENELVCQNSVWNTSSAGRRSHDESSVSLPWQLGSLESLATLSNAPSNPAENFEANRLVSIDLGQTSGWPETSGVQTVQANLKETIDFQNRNSESTVSLKRTIQMDTEPESEVSLSVSGNEFIRHEETTGLILSRSFRGKAKFTSKEVSYEIPIQYELERSTKRSRPLVAYWD